MIEIHFTEGIINKLEIHFCIQQTCMGHDPATGIQQFNTGRMTSYERGAEKWRPPETIEMGLFE